MHLCAIPNMTSSIPIGPRRAAMVGRLQAATVPIDVFQAQDRRRSVDAARRRELAGGNVNQAGQERPVSKALQGTKHYPTGVSLARENNLMRCHTPSVNGGGAWYHRQCRRLSRVGSKRATSFYSLTTVRVAILDMMTSHNSDMMTSHNPI